MKKSLFNFSNTYIKLPKDFYQKIQPKPVKNPKLIEFNSELSRFLNINPNKINQENGKLIFSGNILPVGAEPIAMAYAGHQFGNFVPQLGDGRAVLIGELIAKNGKRFDLQLKGSGKTAFSRQGDGRSPIGPVIREYLVSEALHHLGVKSTRSLAIVSTGEKVIREEPINGGILTRVASSHIRIGTFELFFFRKDFKSLKKLADYTIKRHFNEFHKKNPYEYLLENVIKSQASLVAKWMSIGFIHGVMNTDNTSISGETIDYGPCAFMDHYNPNKVFSYIDHSGRYSFNNQGKIMLWNLSKFAESIMPLLDKNFDNSRQKAIYYLKEFPKYFENNWLREMRKKFGFKKKLSDDLNLINDFFEIVKNEKLDYTLAFRSLSRILMGEKNNFYKIRNNKVEEFKSWILRWNKRLESENYQKSTIAKRMMSVNPIYIPRNHLVESVIESALQNDFSKMKNLLKIIKDPFNEKQVNKKFSLPPKSNEVVPNTFCGT